MAVGTPDIIEIGLGPGHEESGLLCKGVKAAKIDIGPIHDIKGTGLQDQFLQDTDVVNFAAGDADKAGNAAAQIHKRMDFDGRLVASELSPGEKRKAQVDGCRIEGVGGMIQGNAKVFVGIKLACAPDKSLSKVGIDPPISVFVGFGQSRARNFAADACVIKFGSQSSQAGFDISKAFSVSELSKGHTEKLIVAREFSDPIIALIPLNAFVEFVSGEEIQDLGENDSSSMHLPFLSVMRWKKNDRLYQWN